jgi:hypothetical protein
MTMQARLPLPLRIVIDSRLLRSLVECVALPFRSIVSQAKSDSSSMWNAKLTVVRGAQSV